MNINQMVMDSLNYLFDGYKEHGGTCLFDLREVAEKHQVSAHELGSFLKKEGWIKHGQFEPHGFLCAISVEGINKIDPFYFSTRITDLLSVAGIENDWIGIMETLSIGPANFQHAFDIGKVVEMLGIAEVQFQAQEVYIKLTLRGKEEYEKEFGSGGFFRG
jgi:hypothetical protein